MPNGLDYGRNGGRGGEQRVVLALCFFGDANLNWGGARVRVLGLREAHPESDQGRLQ